MTSVPSFSIWMVILLPYAGAILTSLLSRAGRVRDLIAVLFSFLSASFALYLLLPILQGQNLEVYNSLIPQDFPWISGLGLKTGVLSDPYTIILCNIIGWVSFLIMVYSLEYVKGDNGAKRYFFFMNLFIGSMQLIVLSDNLLALFIGWELVGLCSYALIGYYYKDEQKDWVGTIGHKVLGEDQAYSPSHAGMKAFIMTRAGDVSMLAGILILFIYGRTFSYQQLASTSSTWATSLANSGLLVPVALLIFGGAIGKSAQFPLHEWLPDAMAGPAPVSALIHAATMVKAGVVLVARVAPIFYFAVVSNPALIHPFFVTVAWIGAFTAFLAASQAMVGFELKKILAYSTVSQIGYMMMSVGLAGLSSEFTQGLSSALYHLMSHAIFKASLFLAAGALIHAADSRFISDMGGLRRKMGLTFASFLISVASLSGIPPFSGFWSKDAILGLALDSGQYALFIVGSLTAGMTAFYSFRLLGLTFFGSPSSNIEKLEAEGHTVSEPSRLMLMPYVLLSFGTLFLGLVAFAGSFIPSLNLESSLERASTSYLNSFFPSLSFQNQVSFNPLAAGITGIFVAVGFYFSFLLYVRRSVDTKRFIDTNVLLNKIYLFLYNRWYINAVYYKLFVRAPVFISSWLAERFESALFSINGGASLLGVYLSAIGAWVDANIVDAIANGFASSSQAFSRLVRRIQTGVTEQYIFVFALGVALLLVILVISMGGI
jgi:NADH-quinone oxidoreductase subunit L